MKPICGYSDCKCPAKKFGVCGRHKNYAYKYDDSQFLKDMAEYEKEVIKYRDAANEIQRNGGNILGIQAFYENNLCQRPVREFNKEYKDAGESLELMLKMINEITEKYAPGTSLASNAAVRIYHKILGYQDIICDCCICSLGTGKKWIPPN